MKKGGYKVLYRRLVEKGVLTNKSNHKVISTENKVYTEVKHLKYTTLLTFILFSMK